MGIFGESKTAFDTLVEKVTDEKNTTEDWGLIMSVCDRVGATTTGPKDCLRALMKRLNHQDPHVVIQAITLLDACVNNCGKYFLLEIASRDFETDFRKLLGKSHPKVAEKLKAMLKRWAEGEFSKDPQYSLIPSLYSNLKREGMDFNSSDPSQKKKGSELPKDPLVVSSQQEEDDLAKAIQLSLQEGKGGGGKSPVSGGGGGGGSLYPVDSLHAGGGQPTAAASTPSLPKQEEKKARALYDFEAAEDNELTFKAGEMVIIIDDEDPNWWKGSNHRGEGLFPSNFVTTSLEEANKGSGERKRSVVFNEEVEVKEVEQVTFPRQETIDQVKIESLLSMLHEADPTTGEADPKELPRLEQQVGAMAPLIDAELERTDRRHAQLTRLSHELVDALSLYHSLMREAPPMPQYYPGSFPGMGVGGPPGPGGPPHPGMQQGPYMAPPGPAPHMPPLNGVGAHPHIGGPQVTGPPGQGPPSSLPPQMAPQTNGHPQPMGSGGNGVGLPPPDAGAPPPNYYQAMDPSLYGQGYPGMAGPGIMPGSAPPPTPPLQPAEHLQNI